MYKTETNIAISTLGCRVNQYDSAALMEELKKNGGENVSFNDRADIYIINTCIVTAKTESQSRQIIRQALKKTRKPS